MTAKQRKHPSQPAGQQPSGTVARQPKAWLALAGIGLCCLLAYGNSFHAPFVFDGKELIEGQAANQAWPPLALRQPGVRRIGIYTFALDRLWCGGALWGYHLTNLAIHAAAAGLLYGIVRRTLSGDRFGPRYAAHAGGLALAAALLWALHPLQTQSVTYLYQRFESLMGLFFLAGLYCFVRAQATSRARWWYAATVGCWLLATGTKEVAAMFPFVLLWYDRVFVARSWRELLTRRWLLYGFMSLVLAGGAAYVVSLRAGYQSGGVLFVDKVTPWEYARSQPGVVLQYLRLAFWPTGQCLDYAWPVARGFSAIALPILVIGGLLAATIWAVFRRPAWSFLGGWFFLILVPTSSVFPIIDLAYEHRMYLPLAALSVAVVMASYRLAAHARRHGFALATNERLAVLGGLAALLLGGATWMRNEAYRSEIAIWTDAATKAPHGARAYYNLAHAWEDTGEVDTAVAAYRRALSLDPGDVASLNNLANLLLAIQPAEAVQLYRKAVQIAPQNASYRNSLARALAASGKPDEAIGQCQEALRLEPKSAEAHIHLANLLAGRDSAAARSHARTALQLRPSAEAHNTLGNLLADSDAAAATSHYQSALTLDNDCAEAHFNLATLLVRQGNVARASVHLAEALRIRPQWSEAAVKLDMLRRASRHNARASY